MIRCRAARFLAALSLAAASGCGKSGERDTNPIELLYRVSGVQGTAFRLLSEPEPGCDATGIQSPNADHQFGDRTFTAPHFFVLDNTFQPVRGAFEVLAGQPNPIRIDLFVGLQLTTTDDLQSGECGVLGTQGASCLGPDDCPSGQACNDGFCELVTPMVEGHKIRIELCGSTTGNPNDLSCGDPQFPEAFVGFSASFGDQNTAHFSSCNAFPIAEACRTPATIFLQEAKHSVSAVFDTLGAESRDANLRAELYVDDRLVDTGNGKRNVKVEQDL